MFNVLKKIPYNIEKFKIVITTISNQQALFFKLKKDSQPIPSIPFFLITGERKAYEQPL